ncbi:MAG: hypothetical protein U5M50_04130 [Sphingobium sp.]|nr:hypothetical protein [Sphingobium sp.]
MTDKLVEALDRCAHCDSGAHETEIDRDEWYCVSVICISCLARGPVMMLDDYASEDHAIKAAHAAWNRRALASRPDAGEAMRLIWYITGVSKDLRWTPEFTRYVCDKADDIAALASTKSPDTQAVEGA